MKLLLIFALSVGLPVGLHAQDASISNADFKGHLIGESIADFLRIEPEARQEADVCRQRTERRRCVELIAAIERGQRAEVSTAGSANFVLDAGKLVKLTVLVDDTFENISNSLTQKFGSPSKKTPLSSHDSSGRKWENQLYLWDTPLIYLTIYQDNNPVLQDRRPLLVVESHAEHLLEDVGQSGRPASVASSVAPKQ
jgi:hypothetical protein